MDVKKKEFVIVGGGTGGITVAARLRRAGNQSVMVIDPAETHYYQPLWTLVGGGVSRLDDTARPMRSVIPQGVEWMRDCVVSFDPSNNRILTGGGQAIAYDYLVVAPGIQIDWSKIEGLQETLGRNGVCSNYSEQYVEKTWEFLKSFQGGDAIFTYPNTPIKCGGAPQKIMYLAEHHWRIRGVRDKARIKFVSAGASIFGVAKYRAALEKVVEARGIETQFHSNLIRVDGESKKATFMVEGTGEVTMAFDFLHVAPPMSAPDFIKTSPLANDAGWVDVDKFTLQHNRYGNVFSLGDASSLPTSKTGAAIRKEAPVLVANMLAHRDGKPLSSRYDGYTSCPLVTGYGSLILAEFDYDGKPAETFPFDQSKERSSMYLLKKYLLPLMYWKGMLRGRA